MADSIVSRRWYGWICAAGWLLTLSGCDGCGRSDATAPPDRRFQPTPLLVERHNQAVALMGQFDYAGACQLFQELAQENPGWDDVKVDLAIATLNRQHEGDSKAAEELLAQVIKRNPNDLRALYCRGILALDAGNTQAALEMFQQVAQADPKDGYAAYYTGLCHFQLGDVQTALEWYRKSIEIDSYLNSALYGAFQASLRLGDQAQATEYRTMFERLQSNPQARVAEIKYTRMGPKAEVSTLQVESRPMRLPQGPLFGEAIALPLDDPITLAVDPVRKLPVNVTVCDVNHDGRLDFFLAGAATSSERANTLLLGTESGFTQASSNPLCIVSAVNAALWGDYDNDGLNDVYLLRRGPNQLWRQLADGEWMNVTQASGTSGGDVDTVDGLFFDADHDGDLDLFLANDGPNELLNNNLDGTFRPLAAERHLAGGQVRTVQVTAADIDHDRDLDLVVINEQPPHEVYLNDRLWSYRPASGFTEFLASDIQALVPLDVEADGQVELVSVMAGRAGIWRKGASGNWRVEPLGPDPMSLAAPIAVADVTGDGRSELIASNGDGWSIWDLDSADEVFRSPQSAQAVVWRVANLQPGNGPSIFDLRPDGTPTLWPPGPGRFPFVSIQFTGKDEASEQMRSNRSGVGVQAAARIGSHWSVVNSLRRDSGPGQNLQPIALGTRAADRLDFLRLLWPDGVFQTEMNLASRELHTIEETQRQVASCPVVFAWDGVRYAFVTDVLGVGGLGFNGGFGEYGEPRPWEKLLMPPHSIQVKEDVIPLKITEPMEEVCYLDAAKLVAYDLPPHWHVVIDERFSVNGPPPTGDPVFYRDEQVPESAVDYRGHDVSQRIQTRDGAAADPAPRDKRFIGRTEPYRLVLEFKYPIDHGTPFLVMDGWIEYPYSQTMFAAWQAGADYRAPTVEAQDNQGNWHTVCDQFGYMAGMPRRAAVPLDPSRLPRGTRRLRITTNMEIYWDRLAVAHAETPSAARRHDLRLVRANVAEVGFARRQTHAQRRPDYDYQGRLPLWDTRHLRGYYTEFGDATSLVDKVDGALAIIGPGEEIHIEFSPCHESLPTGWTRRYVLDLNGWCKDMDLYTQDGETVGPLPNASGSSAVRRALHRQFNHRYRAGY